MTSLGGLPRSEPDAERTELGGGHAGRPDVGTG
jgi:hypothetical protein